jgi:hypothetical protein
MNYDVCTPIYYTPLLKKLNGALEKKNYRPVSNLAFVSKLIERCVVLLKL